MHTAKMKKLLLKSIVLLAFTLIFTLSGVSIGGDTTLAASAPVPESLHETIIDVTTIATTTNATTNVTTTARTWIDTKAFDAKQTVVEQPIQGYYYHNFPDTAAVPLNATANERNAALNALKDREFQIYIPEHAPQRTYVNVIAVPNDVLANDFLYNEGWFDIADKYGEILVILLPNKQSAGSTTRHWGSPADEKLYINAVVGMSDRLDANGGQTAATTNGIFGIRQPVVYLPETNTITNQPVTITFPAIGNIYIPLYFVGYGAACAPLEAHTSYVPQNVIAQAFIGGDSAGSALDQSAGRIHAGRNNGLFNIGYADNVFVKQLQSIIDSLDPYIGGQLVTTNFITNADIPVPTLLAGAGYAGADNPSLVYWKLANHTVAAPNAEGVYREKIDNGAWATHYANENIKRWNPGAQYGISKVKATSDTSLTAAEIRGFLAEFSRMNNFTAYSDNINYRLPYQELNVTARVTHKIYEVQGDTLAIRPFTRQNGTQGEVELRAHKSEEVIVPNSGSGGGGTFHLAIFAYEDRDAATVTNHKLDGRDVYIYVPDSAKDKGPVPVVYGLPGTQNGSIQYFNATQWWSVANDEGFVVVIYGQDYASRTTATGNPQGITDSGNGNNSSANYTLALKELLGSGDLDIDVEIDWGRVYASGYSAGASTLNGFTIFGDDPLQNHFAALYDHSISGPLNSNAITAEMMPTYFAIASPEGTAFLSEPWARNVADTEASDSSIVTATAQEASYNAVMRLTAMNGIGFKFNASSDLEASRQSYIDSVRALGGDFWQEGRFINTTFMNWQGIDLFKFTRVLGREHNFVPTEMRLGWEYMSRFRVDPDNGDRYFSPSAFKVAGDEVSILREHSAPTSLHDAIKTVTTIGDVTNPYTNVTATTRTWIDTKAYAAKQTVVEQPLQGYFYHNFPGTAAVTAAEQSAAVTALAGREFQVYIPKHAPQRTYVTVIGVPNGVEANKFLHEQGWFEAADKSGEILVVLLPGSGGWGLPEDELYINAVVGMSNRLDANGDIVTPATNGIFGIRQPVVYLPETDSGGNPVTITFPAIGNIYIPLYFVGYGEACAPLEAHTSYVPENVIAQAFINGASAGSAVLNQSALRVHAGHNNGLFDIGYAGNVFIKQLQSIIDSDNPYIGGQLLTPKFITNADIPVPTLLAGGYATNPSLTYWKSVNHTVNTADAEGVYRERINSGAWATHYANENIKRWNPGAQYGISKVKTTSDVNISASEIRGFLTEFNRMNNFSAYSDNISYRVPYQELNVTARAYDDQNAPISTAEFKRQDGAQGQVELRAHETKDVIVPQSGSGGGGTFHLGIFAYEDRDAATVTDGTLDGREVYIYVPDSAKGNGPAPVMYGIPGTQNGSIQYFGQTQWWSVANDEGFVVVIYGQDYEGRASATGSPQGITEFGGAFGPAGAASVANYTLALKELIKSGELDIGAEIDWGRVYASGYSAGAAAINSIVISGANLLDNQFAALYNHSNMTSLPGSLTAKLMPTYFAIASPEGTALLAEPWANNVADTAAGPSIITAPNQTGTYNSVMYLNAMNGIDFSFEATDDLAASRQSYIDSVKALGGDFWQEGRFINTTFMNRQGIDLVKFTRVLGREHNPIPDEMRLGWEYVSRFRVDPDTGNRYFSPSAFKAAGDEVLIIKGQQSPAPTPNGGSSGGGGSAAVQPPAPTPGSSVSKSDLTYISGANRVATSVAIAKSGWTSAGTVVLAQSLIDSLAATPLAFQNNAPILLTTGTLDPAVLAEIQELGATKVIVTGAVNPEVIAALKAALPNLQIEQSTGANRFETVALLNQQISDPKGVFIIGYDAIPDAVSVASWAAANGFLIEVAQSDGSYTPSAKAQGLTGYIIGGPALVRDISGFTRIYGADRYATNLKVRQTLSFDYSIIYTANGGTLVDALTGSVLAAKTKSTIVLLPDGDPTGVDFGAITDDTKIYSFGGSM